MIVFLDGRVDFVGPGYIDLDVNHVGYRVYVTDHMVHNLKVDEQIRVYTYQHVREDAVLLYGFHTASDRAVFERLITVSGVGPRLAMQMLGAIEAEALVASIRAEDAVTLCTLPGVGKKTAQRMILELKDKLDDLPVQWDAVFQHEKQSESSSQLSDDVTTALIALGYRPKEAGAAVEAVLQKNPQHSIETAVKASLQWLYEHQNDITG
ncbi:Holliday junction branch migration protein RuvA [Alicyclobacillus dauci]|uniref:Holliday junction branch migration complex subunit RuvA n=1 Tax=Alicyclobacillus dauci TaxID=1475485 RepID=A0ABY6Z834_9BACL|nr:Holliday junction branch migration protein RuvA [Alicyclobacillus dauci]WAH38421.1 Holliday junction branch migration protein RuvA [Alicyclobacillus dauci]